MRRLLFALLAVVCVGRAQAHDLTDLVLVNGRVYTLDPQRPWAEALAIRGDRILAVGSTSEVRKLRGPATREIDLAGAFACPGFNDAHVHVESTGALLLGASLLDVHAEAPLVERLREAAGRLPRGSWILRGDWGAYEQWGAGSAGATPGAAATTSQPFTPDRRMIDAVTREHPVLISRFDGSMHLANSL